MEVVLVNASVLALPPSQRAGAIVYDGTDDLTLWRPPGVDRDLLHAYGDTLQSVLDRERAELPEGKLEIGNAVRLHPGKLRCDYVLWVAGRPPHGEDEPAAAPPLTALPTLVRGALDFAGRHDTARVAFGPLGAGRGAADAAERMAAVVRAAQQYAEDCLARGAAAPVEEVLVCAPSAADVAKAKRLTAQLARQAAPESLRVPRVSSQRSGLPRTSAPPRSSSSPRGSGAAPRRAKGKLDPNQLAFARSHATPYDRTRSYENGDWLLHPSFGAGQVQAVLVSERMIEVLFGDGQERKLIHAR